MNKCYQKICYLQNEISYLSDYNKQYPYFDLNIQKEQHLIKQYEYLIETCYTKFNDKNGIPIFVDSILILNYSYMKIKESIVNCVNRSLYDTTESLYDIIDMGYRKISIKKFESEYFLYDDNFEMGLLSYFHNKCYIEF